MYSLCCAIGGELKQDEKAMDYPSLKKMCPAGTVCCPKHSSELMDRVLDDRKRNPVPWTPNTVRLLHVLSHGKMIGAPSMESNDPAQGWLSHDPISKSGPGVCVNVQAFKDVFQTEESMSDSRTVAKENELVICRFVCQKHEKRKGFYKIKGKKEVPCTDVSGRIIDVRVGPVKRGHCTKKLNDKEAGKHKTSKLSLKAMKMCKKFKSPDFINENEKCGVGVKLLNQMAYETENNLEENDSAYLSAGIDLVQQFRRSNK